MSYVGFSITQDAQIVSQDSRLVAVEGLTASKLAQSVYDAKVTLLDANDIANSARLDSVEAVTNSKLAQSVYDAKISSLDSADVVSDNRLTAVEERVIVIESDVSARIQSEIDSKVTQVTFDSLASELRNADSDITSILATKVAQSAQDSIDSTQNALIANRANIVDVNQQVTQLVSDVSGEVARLDSVDASKIEISNYQSKVNALEEFIKVFLQTFAINKPDNNLYEYLGTFQNLTVLSGSGSNSGSSPQVQQIFNIGAMFGSSHFGVIVIFELSDEYASQVTAFSRLTITTKLHGYARDNGTITPELNYYHINRAVVNEGNYDETQGELVSTFQPQSGSENPATNFWYIKNGNTIYAHYPSNALTSYTIIQAMQFRSVSNQLEAFFTVSSIKFADNSQELFAPSIYKVLFSKTQQVPPLENIYFETDYLEFDLPSYINSMDNITISIVTASFQFLGQVTFYSYISPNTPKFTTDVNNPGRFILNIADVTNSTTRQRINDVSNRLIISVVNGLIGGVSGGLTNYNGYTYTR